MLYRSDHSKKNIFENSFSFIDIFKELKGPYYKFQRAFFILKNRHLNEEKN